MARDFVLPPPVKTVSTPPAAPLAAMPELFSCIPYATRLTKPACAARWVTANAPGTKADGLRYSKCRGCAVGARHAKTTKPIELARVTAAEERRRLAVVRVDEERAAEATKTTAPTSAPKESDMSTEKRKCVICGASFEPGRSTQRFCSSHTKAEKVAQWKKEGGISPAAAAASARKEGASAKADDSTPRPRATPKPARTPVADAHGTDGVAPAPATVAREVLRALGFDVVELDAGVFGPGRYVFSARSA